MLVPAAATSARKINQGHDWFRRPSEYCLLAANFALSEQVLESLLTVVALKPISRSDTEDFERVFITRFAVRTGNRKVGRQFFLLPVWPGVFPIKIYETTPHQQARCGFDSVRGYGLTGKLNLGQRLDRWCHLCKMGDEAIKALPVAGLVSLSEDNDVAGFPRNLNNEEVPFPYSVDSCCGDDPGRIEIAQLALACLTGVCHVDARLEPVLSAF
jgi:hypothetical protein